VGHASIVTRHQRIGDAGAVPIATLNSVLQRGINTRRKNRETGVRR